MQPRFATHASAAALSTIANTVECPLGNCDEHLVDVVGMVRRHALLVEELALDAVREPLHVERPAAEVGECELGDADVVRDEVALRQPALGEEQLVGIRDRDVVAADAHAGSIVETCWKATR